jgi:hypothetical protein
LGIAVGLAAYSLSLSGWDLERLWLYMLGSASLAMIGVQLFVSWVVMRVLQELSQRETSAQRDLIESEAANIDAGGLKPTMRYEQV